VALSGIYAGRNYTLNFTLSSVSNGVQTALDLTGAKVYFSIKKLLTDLDPEVFKRNLSAGGTNDEINITNATDGELSIYITADDTKGVRIDNGWYDLVVVKNNLVLQAVKPSRISIYQVVTVL
jgi:hypothetical protein